MTRSSFVGLVIWALAATACGPGDSATTSPARSPAPPPSASATATPAATQHAPPGAPQRPVAATAMAGELKELGLDPKNLPTLNKLSPDQLRKVMKTFTKALGVQCSGCHDTKDFRAPTPN